MSVHTVQRRGVSEALIRVVTAAALVVDAVIHLQLASNYQAAAPGGIGQGNLFRIEAAVALVAAVWVVIRGGRAAYGAALVVAGSALAAVLLYRYEQVPAFGPIPAMYEPVWFFKKTLTALAEAAATLTSIMGFLLSARGGGGSPRSSWIRSRR